MLDSRPSIPIDTVGASMAVDDLKRVIAEIRSAVRVHNTPHSAAPEAAAPSDGCPQLLPSLRALNERLAYLERVVGPPSTPPVADMRFIPAIRRLNSRAALMGEDTCADIRSRVKKATSTLRSCDPSGRFPEYPSAIDSHGSPLPRSTAAAAAERPPTTAPPDGPLHLLRKLETVAAATSAWGSENDLLGPLHARLLALKRVEGDAAGIAESVDAAAAEDIKTEKRIQGLEAAAVDAEKAAAAAAARVDIATARVDAQIDSLLEALAEAEDAGLV